MSDEKRILFQSKGYPEFRFLSNFHLCRIEEGGYVYHSVEHLYQSLKSTTGDDWKRVYDCKTPNEARKVGQEIEAHKNWDEIKDSCMLRCVRIKFAFNPDLAKMLLETDGFELVEYAPWDVRGSYWGINKEGKGENKLGKILMQVREELKERK